MSALGLSIPGWVLPARHCWLGRAGSRFWYRWGRHPPPSPRERPGRDHEAAVGKSQLGQLSPTLPPGAGQTTTGPQEGCPKAPTPKWLGPAQPLKTCPRPPGGAAAPETPVPPCQHPWGTPGRTVSHTVGVWGSESRERLGKWTLPVLRRPAE